MENIQMVQCNSCSVFLDDDDDDDDDECILGGRYPQSPMHLLHHDLPSHLWNPTPR